MTETFKAGVQYDDLTGSAAADRADLVDATTWLEKHGHVRAGEVLVGIDAYISPSLASQDASVSVSASFLLSSSGNFDSVSDALRHSDSISVRKVTVDLSTSDFFALFKRFNVTLSSNGILEGREYSAE